MSQCQFAALLLPIWLMCFDSIAADGPPLKIYILAGQSNMEGHGHERVLDYMRDDPASAPLWEKIKSRDGSHRMIKDVWISYLSGVQGRIDGPPCRDFRL